MLQSASSYDCDGCSHHASFHSMENRIEDEIRKRWEQEAKDKAERDDEGQQPPKKRVRAIEYQQAAGPIPDEELQEAMGMGNTRAKAAARSRAPNKRAGARVAAGKAKGKVTEIMDDEEDTVVELD